MILFIEWRDKTYEELKTSERFYLASLRQQYDAIKMYINWVKPYLKVIHRLKNAQFSENSRDIITAFDTSTSDLELFAIKKGGEDKKRLAKIYKENEKTQEVLLNYEIFSVVRIKMHFRSAPVLTSGKEYQRVPTHIGRCEIDFDGYAMSENEIQAYLKDENNEAFDYLKSVNSSLDSLGKELKDYLEEAEKLHSIQTGTKKIEKKPFFDMPNELKNLKQGFSEILTPLISPFKAFSSGSKSAHISRSKLNEYKYRAEKRKKYIEGSIGKDLFVIQKLFRKAHKLLTW